MKVIKKVQYKGYTIKVVRESWIERSRVFSIDHYFVFEKDNHVEDGMHTIRELIADIDANAIPVDDMQAAKNYIDKIVEG